MAKKPKATRFTNDTSFAESRLQIVFGERGAELAAQVASMAKANAGAMSWGPPPSARGVYRDPYYLYKGW